MFKRAGFISPENNLAAVAIRHDRVFRIRWKFQLLARKKKKKKLPARSFRGGWSVRISVPRIIARVHLENSIPRKNRR